MDYQSNLLATIKEKKLKLDTEKIIEAYQIIEDAIKKTNNPDNNDYLAHLVEVSKIIIDFRPDTTSIVSILLKNAIEKFWVDEKYIKDNFWPDVFEIVRWLSKVDKIESIWLEKQSSALREMFIAMSKDLRVVFIKLSDRLQRIKNIWKIDQFQQVQLAKETLDIYAPIAQRLWIYKLKAPLEEISFKILNKRDHSKINEQLKRFDNIFIDEVQKIVTKVLKNEKVESFNISWRIKEKYSIYS